MVYACANDSYTEVDLGAGTQPVACPSLGVTRELDEDDGALDYDDPRRACGTCGYPLARYPDGIDGEPELPPEDWTPPPPEPSGEYDPVPQQWDAVRRARDVQLQQTDWIMAPPPDLSTAVQGQITANHDAWVAFRDELRHLPGRTPDPTQVVWPLPPPAPSVSLAPPPPFVTLAEPPA